MLIIFNLVNENPSIFYGSSKINLKVSTGDIYNKIS